MEGMLGENFDVGAEFGVIFISFLVEDAFTFALFFFTSESSSILQALISYRILKPCPWSNFG